MTTASTRVRSTVDGLWFLIRGPGRSTTRRLLVGLLAGLLILSVLVFATGLLAFARVHDTADAVRTRTVPAIGEIAAARSALLRADSAAVASFTAGGVQLSGPGEEFQNQIAIASQNLARIAEHNMAGEEGSSSLRLIVGLLVTYTSLIGQADAHFRQAGGETLGAVDLWNASRLLHKSDGGIVTQLDALLGAQKTVLDSQLDSTGLTPGAATVLFVPAIALFVLLVVTNLVFRLRFRRTMNLWLVLAAMLLVALTWVSARVVVSHQRLEATQGSLYQLVDDGRARDAATDAMGQQTLRDLVVRTACADSGGCGDTFAQFVSEVERRDGTGRVVDDAALAAQTRKVTEEALTASADAGLRPLIYVLAILLAGAVFLGFRPRLYEYRYRPR